MIMGLVFALVVLQIQIPTDSLKFPTSDLPLFGIAELSQDRAEVRVSVDKGGEIRVQTYQAQMPVIEDISKVGEPEIRVTKLVLRPKKRLVYHGMEMDQAGTMNEPPIYSYPRPAYVAYKLSVCRFLDIDGKPLSAEHVLNRLESGRQPILIVTGEEEIAPFYKRILNPELLMLVPPKADSDQRKGPLPPQIKNGHSS